MVKPDLQYVMAAVCNGCFCSFHKMVSKTLKITFPITKPNQNNLVYYEQFDFEGFKEHLK